ncbi:MAG: vitamin K epoxide reductase family protein [Pseudomonadota bacterium]
MAGKASKPIVLITGAGGNLGATLAAALSDAYRVVGFDLKGGEAGFPLIAADLTSDESTRDAFAAFARRFGRRIASVVHLAAYFDFTGEEHPLYERLNVEGTRRLLEALKGFEVEQLAYASTILVQAPVRPGERLDERGPVGPKWAYPRSKAAAEAVIRAGRGTTPCVILRLAGVYDETVQVPTLARQIARIYERDPQGRLYSGDLETGQSMLHRDDMVDAFRRAIDRRARLPKATTLLVGEPDAMGYGDLQDALGRLIHGEADWATLEVPADLAAAGAWAQAALEPLVPDAIDRGEKPFVRPFMTLMAGDHYALDVSQAKRRLAWAPTHRLADELPAIVARLKADPVGWYRANGIPAPDWLTSAAAAGVPPESVRARRARQVERQQGAARWAHFANLALGGWLLAQPPLIGLSGPLAWSEVTSGAALIALALLALSPRAWPPRWACAAVGLWIAGAPMLFWTTSAAAFHGDMLVGALVTIFAVGLPPEPGVSPTAAVTGPVTPPGWDYNPSAWTQRLPIVLLALVGLHISGALAAYQLGHVGAVWDPLFPGTTPGRNGSESVVTSPVSEAWPVSDAAVGAFTYLLEVVTGVVGSRARWRTMPWLVIAFGLMIAPLGVVSIGFITIQPIVIGTWCALCLIAAAAMLVQIPYSIDELVATFQFLARRKRAGRSVLRVLLAGDTDEGRAGPSADEFARPAGAVARDMVSGGVSLPWNLALAALTGVWLMFTRLTLGAGGAMADADHLVGALALTVVAVAAAEPTRSARFLLAPLGLALPVAALVHQPGAAGWASSLACGLALVVLAVPRGRIRRRYGGWNRWMA